MALLQSTCLAAALFATSAAAALAGPAAPPQAERKDRAATAAPDHFVGIGLQLDSKLTPEGHAVVRRVIPSAGPDVRRAVKPGDRITRIEGTPTKGMAIETMIRRIRGREGTAVTLTLSRPGETRPREVTVRRKRFEVVKSPAAPPSVPPERRSTPGPGGPS